MKPGGGVSTGWKLREAIVTIMTFYTLEYGRDLCLLKYNINLLVEK
jgi:hypothetical protein